MPNPNPLGGIATLPFTTWQDWDGSSPVLPEMEIGAVIPNTIQDLLYSRGIDVDGLGAYGDGDGATPHDDAGLIQNAITLAAAQGQGTVLLGPRTYRITTTLVLPQNVHLCGTGRKQSILQYTGAGSAIALTNGRLVTPLATDAPQLADFTIALTSAADCGVDLVAAQGAVLSNILVKDGTSQLGNGGTAFRLTGYHDVNTTTNSVPCERNRLLFCDAQNCHIGFDLLSTSTTATDGQAQNNTLVACNATGTASSSQMFVGFRLRERAVLNQLHSCTARYAQVAGKLIEVRDAHNEVFNVTARDSLGNGVDLTGASSSTTFFGGRILSSTISGTARNDLGALNDFINVADGSGARTTRFRSGPINATVYDTGGAIYNILADGVDNTGLTAVETLVNTRIQALAAAGGGTVLFPAGTYRITTTIVGAANVRLVGAGKNQTIFLVDDVQLNGQDQLAAISYVQTGNALPLGADLTIGSRTVTLLSDQTAHIHAGDLVYLNDSSTNAQTSQTTGVHISRVLGVSAPGNPTVLTLEDASPVKITASLSGTLYWYAPQLLAGVQLADFTIKANVAAEQTPLHRQTLITLSGVDSPVVERVHAQGSATFVQNVTASGNCIYIEVAYRPVVRHCTAQNSGSSAAGFALSFCSGPRVESCNTYLCAFGVTIAASPFAQVLNNQIHGLYSLNSVTRIGRGIKLQAGSCHSIVAGNVISDCAFHAIYIQDSWHITISANTISNSGIDTSEHGIIISGFSAVTQHHCTITGNVIKNVAGYGILLSTLTGSEALKSFHVVSNNVIEGCYGSVYIQTSYNLVTANTLDSPTSNVNLQVVAGAGHNTISNNVFNQPSGIGGLAVYTPNSAGGNFILYNRLPSGVNNSLHATDIHIDLDESGGLTLYGTITLSGASLAIPSAQIAIGGGGALIGTTMSLGGTNATDAPLVVAQTSLQVSQSGGSHATTVNGLLVQAGSNGGTVTTAIALVVSDVLKTNATVAANYGIYINPMTGGSAANYGLYISQPTGPGAVALQVAGGNSNFGGTITASGAGTGLSVTNNAIIGGTLLISGAGSPALSVTNNAHVGGNLDVTGTSTLTGAVTILASGIGLAVSHSLTVSDQLGVGGGGVISGAALAVTGTSVSSATTQYGLYIAHSGNTNATVSVVGVNMQAGTANFVGPTPMTSAVGLLINDVTLGTNATVATSYGIYISAITHGTTNYGLYVQGGQSYFGSLVTMSGAGTGLNVTTNLVVGGTTLHSGLVTLTAGLTGTGTWQVNATGAGTTTIGSATAGAFTLASGNPSSIAVTGANLTLQTLTSGALVLSSIGALTMTAAAASSLTVTGANLTIQTLTSGTLFLTSAGALTAAAAAASSITVTSANLSLITATSGALVFTSAGAITMTAAAPSSFSGAVLTLNATGANATNINTGTSTGPVNIGTALAGALTFASGAASSITVTGNTLTLQTLATGAILLTAAGALTANAAAASLINVTGASLTLQTTTSGGVNITAAAASTWAMTGGVTISTGTLTITTSSIGLSVSNDTNLNGRLAVGGGGVLTGVGLSIAGTNPGATATQWGIFLQQTFTAAATVAFGLDIGVRTAANTTLSNSYAIVVRNSVQGANASVASNYGIYIETITAGSITNDALHVAGSRSYFGGTILADGAGTGLTVTSNATIGGTLTLAAIAISGGAFTLSGGTVSINANSNFATNINTGSSTGAITLGNAAAGVITLQSAAAINITAGAASVWSVSGGITMSTAVHFTGAGTALIVDHDVSVSGIATLVTVTASGLITGTLGTTITGAAVSLNASSNFPTSINTGTSTGAVNVGNASAGAITLVSASTINLTAGAASVITVTGGLTIASSTTFSAAVTLSSTIAVAGTTTAAAITASGLITGTAGAALSGATIALNASSNFTTNINTGSSTGAVNIGNGSAGAIGLVSGAAITISAGAASVWTITGGLTVASATTYSAAVTFSSTIAVAGTATLAALTASGLVTANAGLTAVGAVASINASSNFNTVINTGSSTGSVTIGNNAAGTIALVSGAAISLTAGAASTWSFTGGLTISSAVILSAGLTSTGAAIGLNTSSNFATNINTGTSTGSVSIGNAAAGALTIASGAASTISVTGATLTLQTLTSGGITISSAGAATIAAATTITVQPAVAPPAGGSAAASLLFGSTAAFGIYYGSGAPTFSAAKGSLYLRTDGSTTTSRAYVATDAVGTWTAITTSA